MNLRPFLIALTAFAVLNTAPAMAEEESAEATLQRGIDYAYGRKGKKKDEKKALQLYGEASAKGSAEAAYRIARMHYYGVGTSVDKAKAKEFYLLAAGRGHAKAAQELEKLFGVKAPAAGADLAPASVKGKTLVVDYSAAKIREYDHATQSYGKEHAWEWGKSATWDFDKSSEPTFEEGNTITYTKDAPDSATVKIEGWEFVTVYKLHFDTPTSGTMTEETTAESDEWTARNVRFQIK